MDVGYYETKDVDSPRAKIWEIAISSRTFLKYYL